MAEINKIEKLTKKQKLFLLGHLLEKIKYLKKTSIKDKELCKYKTTINLLKTSLSK